MMITIDDKAKWKENIWNKFHELISDYKKEFNVFIKRFGHISSDTYYFGLSDSVTIYIEIKGQSAFIKFQTNGTIEEYKTKIDYIMNRMKE